MEVLVGVGDGPPEAPRPPTDALLCPFKECRGHVGQDPKVQVAYPGFHVHGNHPDLDVPSIVIERMLGHHDSHDLSSGNHAGPAGQPRAVVPGEHGDIVFHPLELLHNRPEAVWVDLNAGQVEFQSRHSPACQGQIVLRDRVGVEKNNVAGGHKIRCLG